MSIAIPSAEIILYEGMEKETELLGREISSDSFSMNSVLDPPLRIATDYFAFYMPTLDILFSPSPILHRFPKGLLNGL